MRGRLGEGGDFLRRCLVLAREEVRALGRSRRGRVWAVAYALFVLLPLIFYLWLRARIPIGVPLDATVAAFYLTAGPLAGLVLCLALGHDTLTRGEHEGWQEGFASLPVGEFTWLLGRTAGRAAWLLAVLAAPFLIGWALASLWAHRTLDPIPFLSDYLGGALLSMLLFFPFAVLAGCVGNSLLGACVILFVAFVLTFMATDLGADWLFATPFPLPSVLFWEPTSDKALYLAEALFNPDYYWWRPITASPDAGRLWPPVASSTERLFAARAAAAGWALLFLCGPFLVRLRRRPGRWKPRIKSMPTFGRWLSETVDQVKPVVPRGRAARASSWAAGTLLLMGLAYVFASAPAARETEAEVFERRYVIERYGAWPNRFLPASRSIELAVEGDGRLIGEEVLEGSLAGCPGRPVPFALAPGMEVTRVEDGAGKACPCYRELEFLWVTPPPARVARIRFAFRGSPRATPGTSAPMAKEDILEILRRRSWTVLSPQLQSPEMSGISRWNVDLERVAWAPEPARTLSLDGRDRGREPCRGVTTLDLTLPSRVVPLPLPGDFTAKRSGGTTTVRWKGRSPLLPPVRAGGYQVKARPGSPQVTAAVVSPASDLDGLLDRWAEAWAERPQELGAAPLALWPTKVGMWEAERWRGGWESFQDLTEVEPERLVPDGIVPVSLLTTETRPMKAPDPGAAAEIRKRVALARARLKYAPLADGLEDAQPLVRMTVWRLLLALESWPPPSGSLELAPGLGSAIPKVRTIDLSEKPPPNWRWRGDDYRLKLDLACDALISALGAPAVEKALGKLAAASGAPSSFDEFWRALAGERAEELRWLEASLFRGRTLAKPGIAEVTFKESPAGYKVLAVLANEGDAPVVVPVRALAGGEGQTRRVPLDPGGRCEVGFDLKEMPDRVVLDPEGSVLREKPARGDLWTRKGGLR